MTCRNLHLARFVRRTSVVAALVAADVGCWNAPSHTATPRAANATDTIAEVAAMEQRWKQGYTTWDTAAISSLLAPDYVAVGAAGFLNRRHALANLASGIGRLTDGVMTFDSITIRRFGNVAVVTGIEMFGFTDPRTTPPTVERDRLRFTRVWVRTDRGWLAESFQTVSMPPQSR